ncbi:MAG: Gfo/Idh/MocA family oxidoreductase [Sedimentisphaerales bacterium]|nr:Gfo/Idh/MocA family oxidoreductase [Sedimentisphaerales bacterium]
MDKVRVGVIGLGFFGEKHAEVLSDMQGVELAAVCTRRPHRLKEIADKFGVDRTYTDYKELLSDDQVDVVNVVTHYKDHYQITVDALKAGKHVFLEKPMAGTVSECEDIVAAAKSAEGFFMVGHICRFDPRITAAKEAIDNGSIGKIVYMHATRNLSSTIGAQVLNSISALMGDGIHDTDLMLWFSGSKIKTVYANEVRLGNYKYADIGSAVYRFDSGAIGVIESVWALPENTPFQIDARFEIIGTEGAVYINCGEAGITINDKTGIRKPDTAYWPYLHGRSIGALRSELSYFTDCIRAGKAPDVISPEESKLAVEVICAAERSAKSGEIVVMKPS